MSTASTLYGDLLESAVGTKGHDCTLQILAGAVSDKPASAVSCSSFPPPRVPWSIARRIGSLVATCPAQRPAAHALLRALSLAPTSAEARAWDTQQKAGVRNFALELALALRPGNVPVPDGSAAPPALQPGSPEAIAVFLAPALLLGALAAPKVCKRDVVAPSTASDDMNDDSDSFPTFMLQHRWLTVQGELSTAVELLRSLPAAEVEAALAVSTALSLREERALRSGDVDHNDSMHAHVAGAGSSAAPAKAAVPARSDANLVEPEASRAHESAPASKSVPVDDLRAFEFPLVPVPRQQALAEAEAALSLLQARTFERLTAPPLKLDWLEGQTPLEKAASIVKGIALAPLFLLGHWLGDRPRKP